MEVKKIHVFEVNDCSKSYLVVHFITVEGAVKFPVFICWNEVRADGELSNRHGTEACKKRVKGMKVQEEERLEEKVVFYLQRKLNVKMILVIHRKFNFNSSSKERSLHTVYMRDACMTD